MFIEIQHQKLLVVVSAREMIKKIYTVINAFPTEEKYAMGSQLRRAALSVYLNITEGCSRKSLKERERFFEIARGSLIEVDSIFDVADDLGYLKNASKDVLGQSIFNTFKLLSNLLKSTKQP
jgi:four helix bundle protein